MRWKEKLYERPLKRPIDEQTKAAIHSEFHRRRDQIPDPDGTVLECRQARVDHSLAMDLVHREFHARADDRQRRALTRGQDVRHRREPSSRRPVHRKRGQRPESLTVTGSQAPRRSLGNTPMAQKKDPASPEKTNADLRFKTSDEPLDFNTKRFDIFLIDTGWNSAVAKVVRAHLGTIFQFEKQDAFYLLSPEQSVEIIRRAPHLIGNDPIMLVYDHYAPSITNPAVIADSD